MDHKEVDTTRRQVSAEGNQELHTLTHSSIVVKVSGLGARELAPDDKVLPVRGQTVLIKGSLNEAVLLQGSVYTNAIPRGPSGSFILGGIRQPGCTSPQPDLSLRQDVIKRINRLTAHRFAWVDTVRDVFKDIVGFGPSRMGGLRVERQDNMIHAYGAGGLGYVYSWGVANQVVNLVEGQQKSLI